MRLEASLRDPSQEVGRSGGGGCPKARDPSQGDPKPKGARLGGQ